MFVHFFAAVGLQNFFLLGHLVLDAAVQAFTLYVIFWLLFKQKTIALLALFNSWGKKRWDARRKCVALVCSTTFQGRRNLKGENKKFKKCKRSNPVLPFGPSKSLLFVALLVAQLLCQNCVHTWSFLHQCFNEIILFLYV